jgi:hypothetical protein
MGPFLYFNASTESFTTNSKANQMLTRQYREPYVVPEHV